jgi:hypothetical protein
VCLKGSITTDIESVGLVVEVLVDELLAIGLSNEVTVAVTLVDLAGTDDLVLGILSELVPVSEPASKTGKSEHDSEHLGGDAEGLVYNSGVEVNVGVEFAVNEVAVSESNLFECHGNVDEGFATHNGEDIVGDLADNSGSGVVALVDAVTKAHKHLFLVLDALDERGDVLNVTNLLKHAEHGLVGTTVAGAVEGSYGTSEGSVDIGLRGGHVADGGSGAVEFVLGVEDKEDFNGAHDLGVHTEVLIIRVFVHHVEEVLDVAKVLLGRVDLLADTVAVAGSSDGRGAAHHAVDVLVALLTSLVDIGTDVSGVGLGVEGAHGGHEGAHHCHWVSVVAESLDERLEAGVVAGVAHDFFVENGKLLFGWKFSIDNEEGGLEEGGLFGELLNGITAVLKDSLVSVDEGDTGNAGDGVHEGGVVAASDFTISILHSFEIFAVDSTVLDFEFVLLA